MTADNITGRIIELRVLLAGDTLTGNDRSLYVVELDRLEAIMRRVKHGDTVTEATTYVNDQREWARNQIVIPRN